MLFTKIRLAGRTNIDLPFLGLRPTNTYILKAADGLGPPEVDVNIDDGMYLGRQPQDREVVLRVGLNPNYAVGETVSSIRNTLYGLLTPNPSDAFTMKMMNGPTTLAQVNGYVKKFEIVPFSKDPEVQLTIACIGPYLTAPNLVTVVPDTTNTITIDNIGNVTTGFYMELAYTDNLRTQFSMYSEADNDTDGPQLHIDYDFNTGDHLKIDTRKNQKSLKVLRSGSNISVLRGMSSTSLWFQLHPGENTFWFTPNVFDWVQVSYTPQYWGI